MKNTLSFSLGTLLGKFRFYYRRAIFFIIIIFVSLIPLQSHAQITGATSVCVGADITLIGAPSGGTWSSANPSIAVVGSSSGTVHGVAAGTVNIYYTVGLTTDTASVTVNSLPAIYTVTGGGTICAGATGLHIGLSFSTSGINYQLYNGVTSVGAALAGTGAPLDFGLQSTAGTYTVVATNPATSCSATMSGSATIIVNPLPAPIIGPTAICASATITLTSSPAAGTWASSTPAVATVGSATGVVTGITIGTTVITYTLPTGCYITETVTVTTAPCALPTLPATCAGSTATLTDCITGGVWSSSLPSVATIGSLSGLVTGIVSGTTTIGYSFGAGCTVTATLSVTPAPSHITGPSSTCTGSTITLTDTAVGGVWASSNTSVAAIGSVSGIVTGVSSGTAIISYTIGSGCRVFFPLIVNPSSPISGLSTVCVGQTISLSDSVYGGSWSSSATSVATVIGGGVTGVNAGIATISYTTPAGCIATTSITVNPVPAPITGIHSLCAGSTINLTDLSPGGTWSSSNTFLAMVSPTGIATGITAGTDTISYSYPSGCAATFTVTVDPLPAPIAGSSVLCIGGTITLTDPTPGGTWHSGLPTVATIGISSGIVSGVAAGSAVITYLLPTACFVTDTVSVIVAPAPISGSGSLCAGNSIVLTDLTLGGAWNSSNTSVATIDPVTGSVNGLSPGTSTITYSTGAGCSVTRILTVNPLPSAISGSTLVCQGATITLTDATPSGTWSSGNPAIATINAATGLVTGVATGLVTISYTIGAGCSITTSLFVNPLPAPITGIPATCPGLTTSLSDATAGGSWASSNPVVATVDPSGIVSGLSTGTDIISYIAPTSCIATITVTINPFPTLVSGAASVCVDATTMFTDGVPGGSWSSSNPAIASVGSSTGMITGVAAGSATIIYSLGAGCSATKDITVNPLPPAISGPASLCAGSSLSLSDASPGGTWSSSSPAIAAIGSGSGVVTGISTGTAIISYTLGCSATLSFTVNPMPSAITGWFNTCIGGSTTLSDSVSSGTWSSSTPSVATVGSVSGIVTGVSSGATTIHYTLPGGCFTSAVINVYPAPSLFTVTGGGGYCSGGAGVHIGLSGSAVGVNYLLYRGITATGTFSGTGSSLDFGPQTIPGVYTVIGTSALTGCSLLMSDSAVISILPIVTPSVSITVSPGDSVCSGTLVTYTPLPLNGGTSPAYQWFVNGVDVSASSSYSYIPLSGDVVRVQLASSAACAVPDTVSDSVRMTVNTTGTPSVTISVTPGDTVCRGTVVTITPTISFGGATPFLSWMKNGAYATGTSLYSLIPGNDDIIYCILQSNYPCRTQNTDTSASLIFTVDTPLTPVVTITASPGTITNPGDTVTLTATVTNGGVAPIYQWFNNALPIPGATNATYTIDTFTTPQLDSFTCSVTSSGPCVVTATQLIYIAVAPVSVPQLTINNSNISVQPNPNKGEFTIIGSLNTSQDEEINLEITDMLGQVVYQNKVKADNGKLNEHIRFSNTLAKGMYLLTLRSTTVNKVFHMVAEQ